CPYCGEGQLQKFLDVDNPWLDRQAKTPVIKIHTVLCFNNGKCEGRVVDSVTGQSCLQIINCDLAVCLNFMHIVDGLWEYGSMPERFMRPRRAGSVFAAAPHD
ncbi:hypothetical protein COEREDRAFT_37048, partial [Coemansia reversa NRRL 1564]